MRAWDLMLILSVKLLCCLLFYFFRLCSGVMIVQCVCAAPSLYLFRLSLSLCIHILFPALFDWLCCVCCLWLIVRRVWAGATSGLVEMCVSAAYIALLLVGCLVIYYLRLEYSFFHPAKSFIFYVIFLFLVLVIPPLCSTFPVYVLFISHAWWCCGLYF